MAESFVIWNSLQPLEDKCNYELLYQEVAMVNWSEEERGQPYLQKQS